MQWLFFMHFSLAFIQASVMCLLKYFRFLFVDQQYVPFHTESHHEVSPLHLPPPWRLDFCGQRGLTSRLVKISSQWEQSHYLPSFVFVNIKELQVPASEVPGSEVWFKVPITPNWQVVLFFICRLYQEPSRTSKLSSDCCLAVSPFNPAASAPLAGARRCWSTRCQYNLCFLRMENSYRETLGADISAKIPSDSHDPNCNCCLWLSEILK